MGPLHLLVRGLWPLLLVVSPLCCSLSASVAAAAAAASEMQEEVEATHAAGVAAATTTAAAPPPPPPAAAVEERESAAAYGLSRGDGLAALLHLDNVLEGTFCDADGGGDIFDGIAVPPSIAPPMGLLTFQ